MSVLKGESILNDATALTIYSIAIAVPVGSPFRASAGVGTFVATMLGGLTIGLAVGWIIAMIRARIEDTPVEITISLLTPYAVFPPAQELGAAGVIATVVTGLYLGRRTSRMMGPDARLTGRVAASRARPAFSRPRSSSPGPGCAASSPSRPRSPCR